MAGVDRFDWRGALVKKMMFDKANNELGKLSRFVLRGMQMKAPVKTGHLRESMSYDHDLINGVSTFLIPPFYGVYQEFGTRHMRPHPFIRPTLLEAGSIWHFKAVLIQIRPAAQRSEPLKATTSGFKRPKTQKLTWKQEKHVRHHLVGASKYYAHQMKRQGIKYRITGPK